ncbi:MAG: hypothetical protein C0599_14620 [Salinivirgaceae bacterium]|nr:MAG: hypothetical protein C0599_14620 [Salinivirgaceae bacterium]
MNRLKLIYFIFISTLSCQLFSQLTTIPDSNFEQALIELGFDTGSPNGTVPTENIENVTLLDITDKNISDLTGVEDFTALDHLKCSYNHLNTLDVSQNINLVQLECDHNFLSMIEFENNINLVNLFCSYNELEKLDLCNNVNLKRLQCDYNQIDSLYISNSIELWLLNCAYNNLTELDVSNNAQLKYLDFSINDITDINLSENGLLWYLDCSANNLTNIDVSNNFSLEEFNCAYNNLSSLDISNNIDLWHLGCSYNQLSYLDVSLNSQLRSLNCRFNNLHCLNVKNGNNINFWGYLTPTFDARNNENLGCIEVDDAFWSGANWSDLVDSQAYFSIDCFQDCTTINGDVQRLPEISVYPNPTERNISIDLGLMTIKTTVIITNIFGQTILRQEVGPTERVDIEITGSPGVYLLCIESCSGQNEIIKIIKK